MKYVFYARGEVRYFTLDFTEEETKVLDALIPTQVLPIKFDIPGSRHSWSLTRKEASSGLTGLPSDEEYVVHATCKRDDGRFVYDGVIVVKT